MRIARALVVSALVVAGALAQDLATARGQLEAAATKGDAKALAQALGRRGGDWFEVVLSAIGEPMAATDATKALIAALPEPERAGLDAAFTTLAAAPPADRQAFANALGALTALGRTFADSRDPKAVTDAATLAEERTKAAKHPWIVARGIVARAIARFDADLKDLEPDLAAALAALTAAGDRYGAAIVTALHARALADSGELEKAAAERGAAQAALKALAALDKSAALRALLARIDLALALPFFDDARDDDALECCVRARAILKTADPVRDLEASAIEAAILVDRGRAQDAVAGTSMHLARVPQVKDKGVLVRFSVAVATAMRIAGKSPAAIEFLRKSVGRAKELGLSPNEESPLRMAMALAYVQSQQNEAAHAALEVVAKFASEPALRPLAKAAVLDRAILLQSQGRADEVAKALERANGIQLDGPTLDRIASAGPKLSFAERLVDQGKPKEALAYMRDAATVSEELGVRLEDVRMVATTVGATSPDPIHVRLGIALGSYDPGGEWAAFEPVFLVTERRLQEVLAKGAPEQPPPADMAERLRESDRQVLKLRRSAAGARGPISEEEARRIVAFRKVMIEDAWANAPTFALRRFPRAGSIKRARDQYCGVDGAIFGASLTEKSCYAFAFSRDRFVFSALNASLKVHDEVAAFAALAKDATASPANWIATSAPVWEHLIQKQLPVFEDKQWLVICPDPSIDDAPLEALVAPDAKSDSWKTLPYLIQRIAVGRLPTSSLVQQMRNRRVATWIPDPFLAVMLGDQAALDTGVPFGHAFDGAITAEALLSQRAGVFKVGAAGGAAGSAPSQRPRILAFARGVPEGALGWAGPSPAVVYCSDPPPVKDGANLPFEWMVRGVRAVIAPKRALDKPLADAIMIGTLKGFGEGLGPVEALAAGKRSLLSANPKGAAAGLPEALHHPSHWTQMQVWLCLP